MEIPEGWKLVPVEPTREMYAQFLGYDGTQYTNAFDKEHFIEDWERMLAAAPTPPPQKDEPVAYRITSHDGIVWLNSTPTTLRGHVNEPLYTYPDNSELRKAVAEYLAWYPEAYVNVNINLKALRAALEGK